MANAFYIYQPKKKSCWWCLNLILLTEKEDVCIVYCKKHNWERLVWKYEVMHHYPTETFQEFRRNARKCKDFEGEEYEIRKTISQKEKFR